MSYQLYIDGKWQEASSSREIRNPATGEIIARAGFGTAKTLWPHSMRPRRRLNDWKSLTAYERGGYLDEVARQIRMRAGEIAAS